MSRERVRTVGTILWLLLIAAGVVLFPSSPARAGDDAVDLYEATTSETEGVLIGARLLCSEDAMRAVVAARTWNEGGPPMEAGCLWRPDASIVLLVQHYTAVFPTGNGSPIMLVRGPAIDERSGQMLGEEMWTYTMGRENINEVLAAIKANQK